LAIVKATAEMHGGKVFATSAGGVNTFAFSVAASRNEQASAAGASVAANEPAGVQMQQPASANQ
jgi:two-component system heavy metal sensor histidine kinase CusS